jgi:FkbM family methyltransferase
MDAPPVQLQGVELSPAGRRARLMDMAAIDLVIDVGANRGQYAAGLRSAGYQGRIVSFEPLVAPYGLLAAASASDPDWECARLALGRRSGTAPMNVAEDTRNSSMFAVGTRHVRAVPDSRTHGMQRVPVDRLDRRWPSVRRGARRPYLKIDTQGAELDVLRGAAAALDDFGFVEVELSLLPVYDSAPLFADVLPFLTGHGFTPIAFEGVLDDVDTGEMLQVDAIFRRRT